MHLREYKKKRIFQFVLLIYISFIFISCNKNPIMPINTNEYYTVSGRVYEQIDPSSSPSVVREAPVVLDNDTAITNFYGEYTFDKVPEGSHILRILLPNYEPYLNTVTVLSDTSFWITLHYFKEDYFPPIELNSQKRFRYTYQAYNGIQFIYAEGEALWAFDSLKSENGNRTYFVKETLIDTLTINGGNSQIDTLITTLIINEDTLHFITMESLGSSIWNGISFWRYLDPRLGEVIKFPIGYVSWRYFWLKKNVGLCKVERNDNLHPSIEKYELIE